MEGWLRYTHTGDHYPWRQYLFRIPVMQYSWPFYRYFSPFCHGNLACRGP